MSERLKKARKEAGFSINDLSREAKVQSKYIELLEAGRIKELPAPVYMQGFLKKCARALRLEEKEILAEYRREAGIFSPGLRPLSALKYPKFFITPKTFSLALFILIGFFILIYLFFQFDNLVAAPEIILDYPSEDLMINRSSIELHGRSDPSAKLTVNGEQLYVEDDGSFRQEINLSPGLNILKIQAANRFGKKTEIQRNIIVE